MKAVQPRTRCLILQGASIVSEWNLICDDEWKVQFADSMLIAGFFCGDFTLALCMLMAYDHVIFTDYFYISLHSWRGNAWATCRHQGPMVCYVHIAIVWGRENHSVCDQAWR